MRALLFAAALAGCAPAALVVTPEHPASPEAESGRLAGPPAALRPGVAAPQEPGAAATPSSSAPAPAAAHDHAGHH